MAVIAGAVWRKVRTLAPSQISRPSGACECEREPCVPGVPRWSGHDGRCRAGCSNGFAEDDGIARTASALAVQRRGPRQNSDVLSEVVQDGCFCGLLRARCRYACGLRHSQRGLGRQRRLHSAIRALLTDARVISGPASEDSALLPHRCRREVWSHLVGLWWCLVRGVPCQAVRSGPAAARSTACPRHLWRPPFTHNGCNAVRLDVAPRPNRPQAARTHRLTVD